MFVTEPAAHSSHVVDWVPLKRPAAQLTHGSVDSFENRPASHATHFTPANETTEPDPFFTTEPAAQASHADASVEPVVPTNLPPAHALQLLGSVEPSPDTYRPAAQSMHATVDCCEYLPFVHALQLVLPFAVSVSVIEPGAQAVHGWVDSGEYWPASHDLHDVAPV